MKINKTWHEAHKMPRNATPKQRLKWHVEHAKNCSCRPLTLAFLEKLKKEATHS